MSGLSGIGLAKPALAVDRIIDAVIAENARELLDIGKARQIFQRQRLFGQQAGDHQRQGGVFRAGDLDRPVELRPAVDLNAIHLRMVPG